MNLKELKSSIENRTYKEHFLILKWEDVSFIPFQYINEISKEFEGIVYANAIDDCKKDIGIFEIEDNNLYVYNTLELSGEIEPADLKTTIITCKTLGNDFNIEKLGKFIVEVPKLETWQILSYMKFKCPKVREEKLIWLQEVANNDIYRIDNELSKISLFDDQDSMFDSILSDNGFGDLSSFNIYNLSNNVSKNNVNEVRKILLEIDNIDVEPYGLVTNLLREFKNTIKVQMFPNATYDKLHMTEKQYKAVRYYCCGIFNNETLIKCYRFLLDFDRRIKEGEYSNMSNNRIIDHIINNIVFRK